MNILILGYGGREHSIGWKLRENPKIKKIFFYPGNAGTSLVGENISLNLSDFEKTLSWVKNNEIELVITGFILYLEIGIVDYLIEHGVKVFAPTRGAAKIELSKIYAKELMEAENIPIGQFQIFSNHNDAYDYVEKNGLKPLVIKPDGIITTSGDMVFITNNKKEARIAIEKIINICEHKSIPGNILIEEYLEGREVSVHAFCDGEDAIMFPASQDHKRLCDGDKGTNTAGIGSVAPVPWVSVEELQEIKEKIIIPILKALKKRGTPFIGVLYPGIMFTSDGPKVLEINARMGDPETQVFMKILDSDLLEIILACVNKNLSNIEVRWKNKYACCVTLVSGGYPESYKTGFLITGLDNITDQDITIFHSETKLINDKLVTNGGRVLGVTSIADSLKGSIDKTYATVEKINFEGMYFRKDIGYKLL